MERPRVIHHGLARAILHVTGLGQCDTTINGTKAAPDHLTPGWTKYNKTVLYDTYDITALLQPGANAIGLTLGNGMYNIPGGTGRYAKWTGSSGPRKAIAQIRLEYSNGAAQRGELLQLDDLHVPAEVRALLREVGVNIEHPAVVMAHES